VREPEAAAQVSSCRWAALLLCCLSAAGLPTTAAADEATASSASQLRRQAEHYHRRGHLEPALHAAQRARQSPDGAEDFAVHLLLARLLHESLQLEEAFRTAGRATKLANTPDQRRDARDLRRDLENRYGGVCLRAAAGSRGRRGYIHLQVDPERPLIDPHKKKTFERIRRRLERTELKDGVVIYLPYGHYIANNTHFVLARPEPGVAAEGRARIPQVEVSLAGGESETPAPQEGIAWWWWAAGGGVALLAGGAVVAVVRSTADSDPPRYEARITPSGGYGGGWGAGR